jgi:2-isopropylmalate synthase
MELRNIDGRTIFGVGIDKNIVVALLKAIASGVNRSTRV